MKSLVLFVLSTLLVSLPAQAQRRGDNRSLERRVDQLERDLNSTIYRVDRIERDSDREPKGYYCIAQCQGSSSTAAGGRGRSEAEAKNAAFEAVRKNWACGMEIVECSREE